MNATDRIILENIQKSIDDLKIGMKEISDKVTNIEKREIGHIATCPQNTELKQIPEEVKKMRDDLAEYYFFRKYPKIAVIVFAALVMSMLASSVVVYSKASKEIQKIEILTNDLTDKE